MAKKWGKRGKGGGRAGTQVDPFAMQARPPAPRSAPPASSTPLADYLQRDHPGVTDGYVVLPRALVEDMPLPWQQQLVGLLSQFHNGHARLDWPSYRVVPSRPERLVDLDEEQLAEVGYLVEIDADGEMVYRERSGRKVEDPDSVTVLVSCLDPVVRNSRRQERPSVPEQGRAAPMNIGPQPVWRTPPTGFSRPGAAATPAGQSTPAAPASATPAQAGPAQTGPAHAAPGQVGSGQPGQPETGQAPAGQPPVGSAQPGPATPTSSGSMSAVPPPPAPATPASGTPAPGAPATPSAPAQPAAGQSPSAAQPTTAQPTTTQPTTAQAPAAQPSAGQVPAVPPGQSTGPAVPAPADANPTETADSRAARAERDWFDEMPADTGADTDAARSEYAGAPGENPLAENAVRTGGTPDDGDGHDDPGVTGGNGGNGAIEGTEGEVSFGPTGEEPTEIPYRFRR
ncbi:hypothetical protein HQ32_04762 [Prauserella sp. Am3]|nr:hypothetical protein HQ32_04762 [Prauserella sp. Am3]